MVTIAKDGREIDRKKMAESLSERPPQWSAQRTLLGFDVLAEGLVSKQSRGFRRRLEFFLASVTKVVQLVMAA